MEKRSKTNAEEKKRKRGQVGEFEGVYIDLAAAARHGCGGRLKVGVPRSVAWYGRH